MRKILFLTFSLLLVLSQVSFARTGTIVSAGVTVGNPANTFPSFFGDEGYCTPQFVANNTARDAITAERRCIGETAYTIDTQKTWQLQTGITNSDWVDVTPGTGGGSVSLINTTAPLSGGPITTSGTILLNYDSTLKVTGGNLGVDSTGVLVGSVSGTSNQVTVSSNSGSVGQNITLSLPQDIGTSSSPTFSGMTLSSLSGVLKAPGGVITGGAILNDLGNPNADYSMNSHKLTSVLDPTNPQDAATKYYVDLLNQGLSPKQSVSEATAGVLPANTYNNGASGVGATLTGNSNGALVVDGVTVGSGDRILVKNEVAQANDGIYVVTATGNGSNPYVLTRAIDNDTGAKIKGSYVFAIGGTNASKGFVNTNSTTPTIGTTAITFVLFNGSTTVTGTSPINVVGNNVSISTGDFTGSSPFTITGGVGSIIGSVNLSVSPSYYFPLVTDQTNWNLAYTNRILSATGTAPLTLGIAGNALTGSMTQSSTTVNGWLSSANFTIFNNKQRAFSWTTVAGTTQAAVGYAGYITNNASLVTVTIPAACAINDEIKVVGKGAGGWKIAQNAAQTIVFGNKTTTSGTSGFLASTHSRDAIDMICTTTNTEWQVIGVIGDITVN